MAKKKKTTKKKKLQEAEVAPKSSFWPLTGAILLIITGFFLLLGGFGTGGPMPVGMFKGAYEAFGWMAYLTPVALVLFGVWKFTSEDHKLPLPKLASMLAFVTFAAAWAHVAFVKRNPFGEVTGGNGGFIGEGTGGLVLNALDSVPASILFFVLATLMFFFAFGISPKVLLNFAEMFKRPEADDTDLAELKARAQENGFQLNEGVPVEHLLILL